MNFNEKLGSHVFICNLPMLKAENKFKVFKNANGPNQKHLWAAFIHGAASSFFKTRNKTEHTEKRAKEPEKEEER